MAERDDLLDGEWEARTSSAVDKSMSIHPLRNDRLAQRDEPVTVYPITDYSAFFRYGSEHEHPRRVVEILDAAYDLTTHVEDGTLHITHAERVNPGAVEDLLLAVRPEGSVQLDQRVSERPHLGEVYDRLPARERAIHGRELEEDGYLEARIVGWDPIHSEEGDCWRVVCRLPWREYVYARTRDEWNLRQRQVRLAPAGDGEWTAAVESTSKPFALRVLEWVVA